MSSTFVLTKMKPILMEALDIHGMFAMFASKILRSIIKSWRSKRPNLSVCVLRYNPNTLLHTKKQNSFKLKFNLFN